jgi:hypothetical protein
LRVALPLTVALLLVSCASDSEPHAESTAGVEVDPPGVSEACARAFAFAHSVDAMRDTHSDLFPAYRACMSAAEWRAASAAYPDAIDGVDPIEYAMTVCANNQDEIGDTAMCKVVNMPTEASALERSGKTGLYGVALPKGAKLIDKRAGTAKDDPSEKYEIDASAAAINSFFSAELPKQGWAKEGTSEETALFFRKGEILLGVLMDSDGGSFTVTGS